VIAWRLLLLLQVQAPEESLETRLSRHAQQGETSLIQAYGEIIATARRCRFPEAEIERLEGEMEAQEIARSAAASESFDAAEYADAFQAGVSAMQEGLAVDTLETAPEAQVEACRLARIDFDSMHQLYRTDYDASPIATSAQQGPTQAAESVAEQSDSDMTLYRQAKADGAQLAQAGYCDLLPQTGTALAIALVNRAERIVQRTGVALDQKMYLEGMEAGFRSTAELMRLGNRQYESQSHSAQEDHERKARYDEDCREIRRDIEEILAAATTATPGR